MSAGLDTSVVLRLLVGEPAGQAEAAWRLIAESASPVLVHDLVVTEAYFGLVHHYRVPASDAVRALRQLLSDRRLQATGTALRVLTAIDRPGQRLEPGLVDRLLLANYAADGARTVTFDKALAKLGDAQLLR